jgi:GWxTD domain-containing protein
MRWTIPAILGAGVLIACSGTQQATRINFAAQYVYDVDAPTVEARLHAASTDHVTILFRLRTQDLLYRSEMGGPPYKAAVRITYLAYADAAMRQMVDSGSTVVNDRSDDPTEGKELLGGLDLHRPELRPWWVRVIAYDANREAYAEKLLAFHDGGTGIRHAFLPVAATSGRPYFDDHLSPGNLVNVRCDTYAGSTLLVEWFAPVTALPPPVFSLGTTLHIDTVADSTFTITVGEDGTFQQLLDRAGRYHFRPDPTSHEGFTLHAFTDAYPGITTGRAMLPPLRYITSMQEFDNMVAAPDRRKAVERFWIDACGGRERARAAIQAYYRRVESANRHFTGTVEGWRSDRGLVHIIFGTPNSVYRNPQSETWIYGEETNLMSLTFVFQRRPNPFSDNDMVLERDPVFKAAWYRNVESWRNGRVLQN